VCELGDFAQYSVWEERVAGERSKRGGCTDTETKIVWVSSGKEV
jgi:hypothetical protein